MFMNITFVNITTCPTPRTVAASLASMRFFYYVMFMNILGMFMNIRGPFTDVHEHHVREHHYLPNPLLTGQVPHADCGVFNE